MSPTRDPAGRWGPWPVGLCLGFVLPMALVILPWATGRLDPLLQGGAVYALLPWFALEGVVAFLLGATLHARFRAADRRPILALALGLGGSVAAALLLWVSAPGHPILNRATMAVFGGPLLSGFWLTSGALLAYAWRQLAEERGRAGSVDYSQP